MKQAIDEIISGDPPPGVSIIMPTYNRAELILETIASIQRQTYEHWELIIIDDGSDDDTEKVVATVGDGRIQFYKAGRRGKNGIIKNIGLEKARGRFVAFIDSDDLWQEEKLEKQVMALNAYPEAGFCLTGGYNFMEMHRPLEYFYRQREGLRFDHLFLSILRAEIAVFAQALMMRRQCLLVTGGFLEEKSFSDTDFILTIARYFPGIILYEPMLYRRIHGSNYIHSTWEKSYEEGLALIRSYRHDPMVPPEILRAAVFRTYINFGEKYLGYKKRRKAFGKFFKAWTWKPFSIVPAKKTAKLLLSLFRG